MKIEQFAFKGENNPTILKKPNFKLDSPLKINFWKECETKRESSLTVIFFL